MRQPATCTALGMGVAGGGAVAVEKLGEVAEETGEAAAEAIEGLICRPAVQDTIEDLAEAPLDVVARTTTQGMGVGPQQVSNAVQEVSEWQVVDPATISSMSHIQFLRLVDFWNKTFQSFWDSSTLQGIPRLMDAYEKTHEYFGFDLDDYMP
jgi:hypothetical protein